MLAFRGQRLGAGRRRRQRRAAPRCGRASRAASCRIGEGRYTLELPLDPPPERLLAELAAAGAHARVAQPDPRDARGPLRRSRSPSPDVRMAPRPRARRMRAIARDRPQRVPRVGPRQGALQPRAVRDPADRRVVPVGQLTAGQDVKIIKDLGLAATSVFGLFIAVFIGIGLVSKEVERRSIYSLLPSRSTAISWSSASTPA